MLRCSIHILINHRFHRTRCIKHSVILPINTNTNSIHIHCIIIINNNNIRIVTISMTTAR